jgi:hypothetical protein
VPPIEDRYLPGRREAATGYGAIFMSITAIAVLAAVVVAFGLFGAAIIWCAREDAIRYRLTHQQNPRTRFRAF